VPKYLSLVIGQVPLRAELLEKGAPKTCAAFLKVLPIRGRVIHARWSGEAVWLPMDAWGIEVPLENATSYPSHGELLYYPGPLSEKELLIPYGSARFASKVGQLAGNHFAAVVNGREQLRKVGETALWQGAQSILIEQE
jgi:hypothetical protein